MSFEPNYFEPISFEPIGCCAAKIPVFARSRECISNVLICHEIKPLRLRKRSKMGRISKIPC